jgi:hypothetical protein
LCLWWGKAGRIISDPDETEEFEIIRATPAEIEANIGTGVIWNGMTIAAWAIAKSGKGWRDV